MTTQYDLCTRALLKIGESPISSFDDGTAEADIAGNLYGGTRDALISLHPWSFATGQKELARLVAEPLADFDHAYQLPADILRVLSVGEHGYSRGIQYRINGQLIHTNASNLVLTYIYRPLENVFPPYFQEALVDQLAAVFCLPLTENTARTEAMHKIADRSVRMAKNTDSQQQPPSAFGGFSLIEAKMS